MNTTIHHALEARPRRLLAAFAALAAVAAPSVALAQGKRPQQVTTYNGVAEVRSADGDVLRADGGGAYRNTFVKDYADPAVEDLFAMYTSQKRTFKISFDGQEKVCGGVSHVFFELAGFWEDTGSVGDTVLGGSSIWCDTASGPDYAVRYPAGRRPPHEDEPGPPCTVATRLADSGSSRVYSISPRVAVEPTEPPSEPLDPIADLLGDGAMGDPGTPGCDAKVYEIVITRTSRQETVIWEGPAPYQVQATIG